jgi:hypothetical protein
MLVMVGDVDEGETISLKCGHQHPQHDMNMGSHGTTILTGKTEELGENPVPVVPVHSRSSRPG